MGLSKIAKWVGPHTGEPRSAINFQSQPNLAHWSSRAPQNSLGQVDDNRVNFKREAVRQDQLATANNNPQSILSGGSQQQDGTTVYHPAGGGTVVMGKSKPWDGTPRKLNPMIEGQDPQKYLTQHAKQMLDNGIVNPGSQAEQFRKEIDKAPDNEVINVLRRNQSAINSPNFNRAPVQAPPTLNTELDNQGNVTGAVIDQRSGIAYGGGGISQQQSIPAISATTVPVAASSTESVPALSTPPTPTPATQAPTPSATPTPTSLPTPPVTPNPSPIQQTPSPSASNSGIAFRYGPPPLQFPANSLNTIGSTQSANFTPPSQQEIQKLRRLSGSTYSSNSKLDRLNLERMRQNQNPLSTREYRDYIKTTANQPNRISTNNTNPLMKTSAFIQSYVNGLNKSAAIEIKPSHEGRLHEDLGVAKDEPIPASKLEEASHSDSPEVRRRAQFAINAKKWHHGKKADFVSAYLTGFEKQAEGEFLSNPAAAFNSNSQGQFTQVPNGSFVPNPQVPQAFGAAASGIAEHAPSASIVPPVTQSPGAFSSTEGAIPFSVTKNMAPFSVTKGMAPASATNYNSPTAGIDSITPIKDSSVSNFIHNHGKELAIAGGIGLGTLGVMGLYGSWKEKKRQEEQKKLIQAQRAALAGRI